MRYQHNVCTDGVCRAVIVIACGMLATIGWATVDGERQSGPITHCRLHARHCSLPISDGERTSYWAIYWAVREWLRHVMWKARPAITIHLFLKMAHMQNAVLVQNASQAVWRPGSARTRWGSLRHFPRPSSWTKGVGHLEWKGKDETGWKRKKEGIEQKAPQIRLADFARFTNFFIIIIF